MRIELDRQRKSRGDVEQALARSGTPMPCRRERRVEKSFVGVCDAPPVVGIRVAPDEMLDRRKQPAGAVRGLADGNAQHAKQRFVSERVARHSLLGLQPAAKAVPRRAHVAEQALPRAVGAAFEFLEPLAHTSGRPRCITGHPCDGIPVVVVRIKQDLCVVRRAPAERTGARIKDPLDVLAVEAALRVAPLLIVVGIVAHEVIPGDRPVLGRARVERGDVVVLGQAVPVA